MSLVDSSCGLDMPALCLLQSRMMHRSFADQTKARKGKLQPRRLLGRSSGKSSGRFSVALPGTESGYKS